MFTKDQLFLLQSTLDGTMVRKRKQGGINVSYIEGWHAIAEANRIFGFDMWHRETINLQCVSDAPCTIGVKETPGFAVTYVGQVRIQVNAGEDKIVRMGTGAGHGRDRDRGQAHESAIKECETDAMKRALMTFGNPFGLALYDKDQRSVSAPGEDTSPRPYAEDLIADLKKTTTEAELAQWGLDYAEDIGRAIGTKARIKEAYISHMAKIKGGSVR